MDTNKEEELLTKRLKELSDKAYYKNSPVYTDFLNLNEQTIYYQIKKEITESLQIMWGGYEEAERRVICFGQEDSFDFQCYPITCLYITPVNEKFAENLSHRDYLGAILNLSIDRRKIGDILVCEKKAYVFCITQIASYIIENLCKVKHTNINTEIIDFAYAEQKPQPKIETTSVSSIRLDTLLAANFTQSRNQLTELIKNGKVFVNGKEITSVHFVPNENDIISVRGLGRFVYKGIVSISKKNKFRIEIAKYM